MNSIYRTLALILCCTAGAMEKKYLEENGGFSNQRLIEMLKWSPELSCYSDTLARLTSSSNICEDILAVTDKEKRYGLLIILLEKGFDLTQEKSPLADAIKAKDYSALKLMIKHAKNKLFCLTDKESPVIEAIDAKDYQAFKIMIDHAKDQLINKKSSSSQKAPLGYLVLQLEKNNQYWWVFVKEIDEFYIKSFDLLLSNGENPYLQNEDNKCVLDIINGELENYMKFKYENFKRKQRPKQSAPQTEKEFLAQNGGDFADTNFMLLKIIQWYPEVHNYRCAGLIDILKLSDKQKQYDLIKLLLEKGFNLTRDLDLKGGSPLIEAIKAKNYQVLKLMIDHTGYKIINRKSGEQQESVLYFLVSTIVSEGCLVPNQNFLHQTLNLLLSAGENPYLKNKAGQSAIDIAENSKTQGLANYMKFKYEQFKTERKKPLIKLLSTGEKLDPTKSYGPFPKKVALLIAYECYKN